MKIFNKLVCLFTLGVFAFVLGGCAIGGSVRLNPNTHFAYPNSNVTAMGPVVGESSTVSINAPTLMSGALAEMAYKDALMKSGGDIIVDATEIATTRMFWTPFSTIYFTSMTVEGTAAKMELGKQKLQ